MVLSQSAAYASACHSDWAVATNQSSKTFGVTVGGEFSAAINNCGLWCVAALCLTSLLHLKIGSTESEPISRTAPFGMTGRYVRLFWFYPSGEGIRILNSLSSHILQPLLPDLGKWCSRPWMPSKTSSFGHGRLEIQQHLARPRVPCGTTNLGCSKAGYPKVK